MKEYGWRMSRPAKSKVELPAERKLSELLRGSLRIYFPTQETVANSKGGLGVSHLRAAGHISSLMPVKVRSN